MVQMLLTSLLNLTTVPTSLLTSLLTSLNQNKPHYMHIYIYTYTYIYIYIILICKIQNHHQIYVYIYILIHITLSFYIHEPHIPKKKTFNKKTSHFTRLPLYPMMTLSVTVQRPEPWSLMSINRTICSAEGNAGVVKEDVVFPS